MLRNTVELVSRKQFSVGRLRPPTYKKAIELLRPVLEPLRIDLASAGSHPFADPIFQRVSDSGRYAELVNRTQFWGRQMLLLAPTCMWVLRTVTRSCRS